ncbi:HAD family hydrolase [Nitriliruptor alkaliphilus]|uniref:HAD family hydrolase n=1 Tax=Nitriliruptor alkaliphilus TaxID=427918 RepID=UPI0006982F2B|nr:HAD family hydrolase [Nitriliruptor alkaliphilus]
MIDVVAFDADDTLWHSESLFVVTQERVAELLAPYVDAASLEAELEATERRNLAVYGYGVKGFTLSLVETAIAVSDGRVTTDEIGTLLDWGRGMLAHPVELLDGVEETVRTVAEDHRIVLVTKGDLFHQESKVAESGLGDLFEHVAVVAEKDPATYARVARDVGVDPARLLMVGNSVRSDVLPVLELGGYAVHIPYHMTWAVEAAEVAPDPEVDGRHTQLRSIRELPAHLAQLRG